MSPTAIGQKTTHGKVASIRRSKKGGKPTRFTKKASPIHPKMQGRKIIRVSTVRSRFGVSQDELSRITGYSVRAIAAWESGRKLSEAARQKMVETERLRAALAEIVPVAELGEWMRTPNSAFEGRSPIQVMERGEADRIWRMIIQIDSAVAN